MAVGILDDRHDINWRVRILAQVSVALLMIVWGDVHLQHLGNLFGTGSIQLGWLSLPFTVFATAGIINAINLADGADGLAGGLSLVALIGLAVLGAIGGRVGESQILIILACCVAGFMIFNYRFPGNKRASVFMGDTGSTLLGFALAWFAIAFSQGESRVMSPMLAPWIVAVPLLDAVAVMTRRVLRGQSPFLPDRQHLHHVFLRSGKTVSQTVNQMIVLALLLTGGAIIAQHVLGVPEAILFLTFLMVFAIYLVATLRFWRAIKSNKSAV